jgi:c-di-GMP-binding flagellar brake protein YcgR
MQERRRFVRLDTRLPVTYQVLPSTTPQQTKTKDIGGGGVCLFLNEPVAVGTTLQAQIKIPDQEHPVSFTGRVVWCEQYEIIGKSRRERSVEAGVEFEQIDPRDQQAIMRYVILSLQPHRSS